MTNVTNNTTSNDVAAVAAIASTVFARQAHTQNITRYFTTIYLVHVHLS